MKKSLLTTIGALWIAIGAFAYSGGSGTEANPYLISSKANMAELATNVNGGQDYSGKYFRLTRDLTGASDTVTTVVGNSDTRYFRGIFDGDGHEIAVKNTGIFGSISGATIKNLGVSGNRVGGICGSGYDGSTITNCYNTGNISSSSGGICGSGTNITITNCYNTGNISSSSGGICGSGTNIK
jgi:hypothetical protein